MSNTKPQIWSMIGCNDPLNLIHLPVARCCCWFQLMMKLVPHHPFRAGSAHKRKRPSRGRIKLHTGSEPYADVSYIGNRDNCTQERKTVSTLSEANYRKCTTTSPMMDALVEDPEVLITRLIAEDRHAHLLAQRLQEYLEHELG